MIRYTVTATATVYVTVADEDADVLERVTEHDWQSQFYHSVKTPADAAAHFAFNALANGVTDVSRLEGWADVDDDAVEITVDNIYTEAVLQS